MFKSITIPNLIIVAAVLIACSPVQNKALQPGNKLPQWIDNPAKLFPESEYMTAVGSGDTRRDAENNALGNLARIFKVEIQVNQSQIENYLETDANGQLSSTFSSLLLGRTTAKANQELKNTSIKRSFFDEQQAVYYALAVLNRRETAALYYDEINTNHQKIASYVEKADQTTDKLHRLKAISKAIQLVQANALLGAQYKIISGSKPPAGAISDINIKEKQAAIQESIVLKVQGNGDNASEVGNYLREALAGIGLSERAGKPDLIISYDLNMQKVDMNRPGTYGLNWQLKISTIDNANHAEIFTTSKSGRSVALNEEAARARIMVKIHKKAVEEFKKQFVSHLESI